MLFLVDLSKVFPYRSVPKSNTFSNLFMGLNYNLRFWIILCYTPMSLIRVLACSKALHFKHLIGPDQMQVILLLLYFIIYVTHL